MKMENIKFESLQDFLKHKGIFYTNNCQIERYKPSKNYEGLYSVSVIEFVNEKRKWKNMYRAIRPNLVKVFENCDCYKEIPNFLNGIFKSEV